MTHRQFPAGPYYSNAQYVVECDEEDRTISLHVAVFIAITPLARVFLPANPEPGRSVLLVASGGAIANVDGNGHAVIAASVRLGTATRYVFSQPQQTWIPEAAGAAAFGTSGLMDLSVNSANVDGQFSDGSIVMRTGSPTNPVGAFNGGGNGNKAIAGVPNSGLVGQPLSALASLQFDWRSLLDPGPNNGAGSVRSPKGNFLVDFTPDDPAIGIRLILVADDSLFPTITAAIGTYAGFPAGPDYSYRWDASLPPNAGGSVLIVNIPGPLGPNGTPVSVSGGVGAFWLTNAFSWSALVANCPNSRIVEAFPANPTTPAGDGGAPAGAMLPPVSLISGDSGNLNKSGKQIAQLLLNGSQIIP